MPNTPQPNESVERVIEEFDEMFSQHIKVVSIGQYDDKGVNIGFLSANETLKHFLTTALLASYTAGRASMKADILAVVPEEKETGIKMYPDKRTKEMRYLYGNSPSSQCIGCGQRKKAEEQGHNACRSQLLNNIKVCE